MNQMERIRRMEAVLDEAACVRARLSEDVERFTELQDALRELSDYYGSAAWRGDKDDSDAGRLPPNLKCGVLSEDAVYDLLTDCRETVLSMLEAATRYLREL